jgi:hypothetical protein
MSVERINFWSLFTYNPDGTLEPKVRVRIGGVEFGPGVKFNRGVAFSGVDLFRFVGNDLQIEKQRVGDQEIYVIRAFYNTP